MPSKHRSPKRRRSRRRRSSRRRSPKSYTRFRGEYELFPTAPSKHRVTFGDSLYSAPPEAPPPGPPPPPDDLPPRSTNAGSRAYNIQLIKPTQETLTGIVLTNSGMPEDDDVPRFAKVSLLRKGSIGGSSGLVVGDILTRVNNVYVDSDTHGMTLLKAATGQITLQVVRRD